MIKYIVLLCLPVFLFAKSLQTQKTQLPPVIDGRISAGEWNVLYDETNWTQLEPQKGRPATEKSLIYTVYTKTHLYFGFHFYADPATLVATTNQRDVLTKSEDGIAITLDTFADQRSGYIFVINPLGTQVDLKVNDDGRNMDTNWDTPWQSAAALNDSGWSAEFAIPFKSIRYDASLAEWGLNFTRVIRANAETSYWSGEMNDDFRISQGGTLTGLDLGRQKPILMTPYTTLRYDDLEDQPGSFDAQIGLDASIPVSTGLTANLTVNPDFATVEGDQEQINLTRWELSFPEKRLFFLEGNDLFSTRIKTFYSRRIGDINVGAKMNGKVGKYNMAALSVRSKGNPEDDQPQSYFNIIRVKRDVLKSSTIGMTIVDKTWKDGNTRSFSADYLLNLGHAWKLTGQYVASTPGDLKTHSAWFTRAAHESNLHHFHVRYSDTGENFQANVNQTGFIRDDDMKEVDSDFSYKWWQPATAVKYIYFSSRNNIFWNHQNTLRSWYSTQSMRMYLQNRFSVDVAYNDEFKRYEKKFYNHKYEIELGRNTDEWESQSVDYTWGRNYDRDFYLLGAGFKLKPSKAFSFRYSLKNLHFNPDPDNHSTWINVIEMDYYLNRDLWLRVFAQNNTKNDRYYVYGLFGWRFKPPFSAVYLIYTTDQFEGVTLDSRDVNRTLFFKLAYQFQI